MTFLKKFFKRKSQKQERQDAEQRPNPSQSEPQTVRLRKASLITTLGKKTKIATTAAVRLHTTVKTKKCRETSDALRYWAYLDHEPPEQVHRASPIPQPWPYSANESGSDSVTVDPSEPEIVAPIPLAAIPRVATFPNNEHMDHGLPAEVRSSTAPELVHNRTRPKHELVVPEQTLGFSVHTSQQIPASSSPAKPLSFTSKVMSTATPATQSNENMMIARHGSMPGRSSQADQQQPLSPACGSSNSDHAVIHRPISLCSRITAESDKENSCPSILLPANTDSHLCGATVTTSVPQATSSESILPSTAEASQSMDLNESLSHSLTPRCSTTVVVHEQTEQWSDEAHASRVIGDGGSVKHAIIAAPYVRKLPQTPVCVHKRYTATDTGSPILRRSHIRPQTDTFNRTKGANDDVSSLDLNQDVKQEDKAGLMPSISVPFATGDFFDLSKAQPVLAGIRRPSCSTALSSNVISSGSWSEGVGAGTVLDRQASMENAIQSNGSQSHIAVLNGLYRRAVDENIQLVARADRLEAGVAQITFERDQAREEVHELQKKVDDLEDLNDNIGEECLKVQGRVLAMQYRDNLARTLLASQQGLAKKTWESEDRWTRQQLERGDNLLTMSKLQTELDQSKAEIKKLRQEIAMKK